MKCHRQGAAVAAASFSLLSLSAIASDERNEAIVVTATRVEQPVSEIIGTVSVITRKDIEQRGVHSLQDLLRGQTGLGVTNAGGFGKLSNIFLRGADAEQVLVLVDGVRVGSATSGTTAFEYLPVEQIERIEIIRGPRSSLYGSDAIGGVIQIFTRRSSAPSFSVGVGSHETRTATASFGAANERAWLNVSGNRIESEGYNSCLGAPFPPGGGCFTYEPDRDGYRNTSGSLRTGYKFGRAEVEATALYATGASEYDGSFGNETDFTERVLTLRGRVQPSDRWSVSLLVGSSRDDQDNFFNDPVTDDPRVFASRFNSERRHASLQADWSVASTQALTFGVDYLDDRVDSTFDFEARARDNLGAFAQYQATYGPHRISASVRHDHNEQFGGHETGSLGWKWSFGEQWAFSAAWGSAFGAPTFNDLYFPGSSNPDLDPETSRSYEAALSWTGRSATVSLAAFETHIDDLIVYVSSLSAPINLNRSRIRGLELDAVASFGDWTLIAGYAALDPRNRSPGVQFDNILPRRARHSGHVELSRGFGPLDARVRVTAEGSRYDDVANVNRLGSYAVVDLIVDYRIAPQWTLQGKLGNALDREYRTVRWYNQEDRTVFVSLRYHSL